ncbi:hypothetical protein K0B04_01550, partial [Patescibacteria group bacterium]|nr:hypothetical protein [Patescibacteria group bacterium]
MKKRVVVIFSLLVCVSILITGCDSIPENLDDFFDWSPRFSLSDHSQNILGDWLEPIMNLLSVLILILGISGLAYNLFMSSINRESNILGIFGGNYLASISNYLAMVIFGFFPALSTILMKYLFPEELN